MPLLKELNKSNTKVLLLGSGGLSIGQAGEFDYSGTQALKALLEEGIEVILVNPNIATVQTNPQKGLKVYLYPVEPDWVEKIIAEEKPDAIIAGFGGQTALNCVIKLDESGVLKKHGVKNLGSSVATLKLTEDRDNFAKRMLEIGMPIPPSHAVSTLKNALKAAEEIGYPVIVRAAYALGGLGSGFADNDKELEKLVIGALAYSPQVLVEKSLKGWKEVEYEVMRDSEKNTITICNMENFDPLGIHTGDSIVVCPSQSLTDEEYQKLRNAAFTIVDSLGVVGECNVQYALDPKTENFYVIEVNARLSRSSALASKASGYPIAYIAAKVVLGYDLLELKNPVTGITFAYYEPALDYITVKVPRWDLKKFKGISKELGSTMKSVGEIMSIGRSFPEAIQKAVRMITEREEGLSFSDGLMMPGINQSELKPSDDRFYLVLNALRDGQSLEKLYEITSIDKWFLSHLQSIVKTEELIKSKRTDKPKDFSEETLTKTLSNSLSKLESDELSSWKKQGFSDIQIALLFLADTQAEASEISPSLRLHLSLEVRKRRKELNIFPVVKKIDTTAAEYPSPSNYLYLSYHGLFHDPLIEKDPSKKTGIVLGSGSYRIGSSVEFDWCAVSCSHQMQSDNWESVMINCNPETVSTDYNSSDRLYFEEMTLERILDIIEIEKPEGVVVSMGGQLPNRLAIPLSQAGVKLLGHDAETIDCAENRGKFSKILDDLDIDQPRWSAATAKDDIKSFIDEVGFPVLIRPSYVLSGAAMNVAYDEDSLKSFLSEALEVSEEYPVVMSKFYEGAREIEMDGVAKDGNIITSIVSEHIENAGVHSGDATMVVPAQKLYVETVRQVRHAGRSIAKRLRLNGPFNIQFLALHNEIKVIECNVRAARSFPFVSKVVGYNLADAATNVMIGTPPPIPTFKEDDLPFVGVKAAMFSFTRLGGADPVLGVEMASTGEVGCIARSFKEALLLSLEASSVRPPEKGVLMSSGPEKSKIKLLETARAFEKHGLPIYSTKGTAKYLSTHGVQTTSLNWPDEKREGKTVLDVIKDGTVDLVINIPKNLKRQELSYGWQIRQTAIRHGCSLLTNTEKAVAFGEALSSIESMLEAHELLTLPGFNNQKSV